MGSKGTIRDVKVADLRPHPRNYLAHPQLQLDRLAKSLQRYGQRKAICVQASTNRVIAGHGIWEAAKQLGWETIRADVWDCTDAEALAYLIDDNELNRHADPDEEARVAILRELDEQGIPALAYDAAELGDLLLAMNPDFEPVPEDDQPRLGQKAMVMCPQCHHEFAP